MPAETHARRRPRCAGFSLIELGAVIVVLAILAAVATPSLARIPQMRGAIAAQQIAGDLAFARSWAMTTGVCAWATFDPAGQAYTLLHEDPDAPGRSGASALSTPTGGPVRVTLDEGPYQGIVLSSVDFDGGLEVGFDALGRPLSDAEVELKREGVVTLSSGHIIRIVQESGLSSHEAP